MKRILIYVASLSCILLGCKKTEKLSQAGIYKLEKQTITGGGNDSTYKRTQIKIYTDHNFMYAGMTPDSSIGFGVGFYNLDTGNRIIEHRIYTSSTLDSSRIFKLKITPRDNGYSQTIPAMATIKGVPYDLHEDYIKLPTGDSSVLDGLWKMDKTYTIKGKDTTNRQVTQFELFWRGYFMFIHHYPVDKAANKFDYGFGYGPFNFKDNKLSEEVQMSNYADLLNQKRSIDITLNGNDGLTQVTTDPKNNNRTVEIYTRFK
jgi:hypothetical protein